MWLEFRRVLFRSVVALRYFIVGNEINFISQRKLVLGHLMEVLNNQFEVMRPRWGILFWLLLRAGSCDEKTVMATQLVLWCMIICVDVVPTYTTSLREWCLRGSIHLLPIWLCCHDWGAAPSCTCEKGEETQAGYPIINNNQKES